MHMKLLPLVVVGCAIVLGGCASQQGDGRIAASYEPSYTPLGTSIPKKGTRRSEDKTTDLQQLENARVMNNGTNNGQ